MEITGKLHRKFEIQEISEKFSKREFVILDDSKADFPQYIKLELFNDKTNLLDGFKKNDVLKVTFNLNGREYTKDGKTSYFNSLVVWKIEKQEPEQKPEPEDDAPF